MPRTTDGRIVCPECEHDGRIELSTKVYFDIVGTIDGDRVTITDVEPSHLNDRLDGHPFNVEGELYVGCEACGHTYVSDFSPELRARITRQGVPLGR